MKLFASTIRLARFFTALGLLLLIGSPLSANAGDVPDSSSTAPCGELRLIGDIAYIYNRSNFSFDVKFTTEAVGTGPFNYNAVNAGAVKYLTSDASGLNVWRDTGEGDYRTHKFYNVPVPMNGTVAIAYCAASSRGVDVIKGQVSLTAYLNDTPYPISERNITFKNEDLVRITNQVKLHISTENTGNRTEPNIFVHNGDLIVCAHGIFCGLQ